MSIPAWPKIVVLVGMVACGALAGLYLSASRRLAAARQARRNDDYAVAEKQLAACWRLPGFEDVLALEDELLGVQQGDLRAEKEWQKRAETASPDGVQILEALAKGHLATFQFNQARDYADAILNRQQNDPQARWLRGRALVHLQQEEKALDDYSQAIAGERQSLAILRSIADLSHKLGHTGTAISEYESLRIRRPDDERVIIGLAHCYQEQARLSTAREMLDAFVNWEPNSIPLLLERGRLALRLGQPEDAEQWTRRALQQKPDHTEANLLLRLCLKAQQKTDAALEKRIEANERRQASFRLTLHETGRQPALLAEYGHWIMRSGDEREAVGWFYAALKEDSSFAPAHAGLADFFARDGQPVRAAKHAQLAGDLSKTIIPTASAAPTKIRTIGTVPPVLSSFRGTQANVDAVHRLCAACHAYPPPDTFPRAAWRKEVKQGYDLLRTSPLSGDFPPLEDVVAYYEQRAPQQLLLIEQPTTTTSPPVRFEKRGTGWMVNLPPFPGVANVNLGGLLGTQNKELLLCDTRLDRILLLKPYETTPGGQALPQVIAPSHSAIVDLDGDGRQDVLVAGLGNFFPTDDKAGKVIWLRALSDGNYQSITLLEGVGRVSDVESADFNADGKLDLVVAVFGWRTTGEILYLQNRTSDWSRPEFIPHVVDARHGAIHVPITDLNSDGRPDFVALISQEHETVVAYLNQGGGNFEQKTIFTAPHPSYGSSGIEIVDLDGDGDRDVLLTNGDVLDRPYLLKPYHGVQWLENKGAFPFEHHAITAMYGASRAVAADFDGDNDLDVVAVSFLPRLEFPERESLRLPSVALFEQTSTGQFQAHVLEIGACDHFSCAAGDWDSDGRIDLAVGNFSWKRSQPFGDAAVLWKNLGPIKNDAKAVVPPK